LCRSFAAVVLGALCLSSVLGMGAAATEDVTVGIILVGSRSDAGYSQQHAEDISTAAEVADAKLLPIIDDVGEDADLFERAVRSQIAQGADIIFAASATFQTFLAELALRFPDVKFEFTDAQVVDPVDNLRSYYGRFYQGNYVVGYAMGRQLALDEVAGRDLSEANVGLVSSTPFPLAIRNAYAVIQGVRDGLGWDIPARVLWLASVSPENPWYNPDEERALTQKLIDDGAVAIHTYLDSPAPVWEVQEQKNDDAGWPLYVSGAKRDYRDQGPDVAVGFTYGNWEDYYAKQILAVAESTWEPGSTWATIGEVPRVIISPMGEFVSDEVQAEVLELTDKIAAGELVVLEEFSEQELLELMELPEGTEEL